jgi:MoxR-like ATPase
MATASIGGRGDTVMIVGAITLPFVTDTRTASESIPQDGQASGAVRNFASLFDAVTSNIARVIRGKDEAIDLAVIALLAEGHLLVEDVPGVGKTSLAKAMSASVDCTWRRVQFTPDLLPTDLIGVSIYSRATESFRFEPGPLFANILLADEINRASPKTQSALLEAMEERQVTADGVSRPLPPPFMVIATQNPVDQEGTYRLPESQLDRFLLRISIGYPDRDAELQMLDDQGSQNTLAEISPVVSDEEVRSMIAGVRSIYMASALKSYLVDIAEASRRHPAIELGLSPRATLQLASAAKAHAAARGRNYATPDDVKVVGVSALAHRIMLRPDHASRLSPEDAIREVFAAVPVPVARS